MLWKFDPELGHAGAYLRTMFFSDIAIITQKAIIPLNFQQIKKNNVMRKKNKRIHFNRKSKLKFNESELLTYFYDKKNSRVSIFFFINYLIFLSLFIHYNYKIYINVYVANRYVCTLLEKTSLTAISSMRRELEICRLVRLKNFQND